MGGAQQFRFAVAADVADREGRGDHQGDADERRAARRHAQRHSHSRISALLRNRVSPSRGIEPGQRPGRAVRYRACPTHSAPPSSRSRPEPAPRTRPAPPAASRSSAGSRRSPGWRGPVSRCESCGLGVVGDAGEPEEALRELDRLGDEERPRIANRASYAASLGSAGWAGLEPGARYLFTVEAVRRLVARRDQVVKSSRWAPVAGLAATWQTLLNSVTFGHNVALGRARARPGGRRRSTAGSGGSTPSPASCWRSRRWSIAIPVELAGGLFRRGAVISLRFELL